jgi:DNA topoisomerase I
MNELIDLPGGQRLFRYEWDAGLDALTGARLSDYVRVYLGDEFTAKDFRTWGGTHIAAVELAERGPAETSRPQSGRLSP